MKTKFIIIFLILGFVFGYTVYEAVHLDNKFSQSTFSETGSVLKKFPSGVKFTKIGGEEAVDLSKFVNSEDISIVHFWATWCGPCEIEFPELVKFIKKNVNNPRFKFLIIAVQDDKTKVKKFLKKYNVDNILNSKNVLLLEDYNNDFNKFGTYKLPETYVFEGLSVLVRKLSGQQDWSNAQLIEFFSKL